ncbi:hypothetical protein IMG5_196480 [Ichthyophthirius multifiliis]|uniref:Uncharacterized protein n=1 Tax=Ichthyophthirius multifiliis TaxID=5932 RepID=G0R554_ICHMU|nr:hypothetical protein IMG5_196480 [Ichthyophthirius multifiliis]EGR27378.1 hypothetical protein IMG5_196480 [Ichthyophthirius multifiliis]|eukprot:XP_004024262.1 hypothetical protein IMG5_196480 [Ichthyophthirius multifiliis]
MYFFSKYYLLEVEGENNDEQEDEKQNNKKEKTPLLFVDVNLGQGMTKRIIVYENDRSEQLANKFAEEHKLDDITKKKFKELLDEQIAGLLSKIEEEVLSFDSNINE